MNVFSLGLGELVGSLAHGVGWSLPPTNYTTIMRRACLGQSGTEGSLGFFVG